MKQHLQRQSGVANVDVSLIDGKVEITPKEDGKIEPTQLLKATYDSGVSVAELDMLARGKVVKDSTGSLAFQVAPNQSFLLDPNDLSKPGGKKKPDTSAPLKLTILEVQKKE